jgi:hypothetical protein
MVMGVDVHVVYAVLAQTDHCLWSKLAIAPGCCATSLSWNGPDM